MAIGEGRKVQIYVRYLISVSLDETTTKVLHLGHDMWLLLLWGLIQILPFVKYEWTQQKKDI